MSNFPITSTSGNELLQDLPDLHHSILEMRVLVQAEGREFDQLQADLEDQLAQRFVSTATWDLAAWEEELGIVPPADQPVSQRRSVVLSKIRGYGKFSGRLLKNVAEAYDNGIVDVSFDPPASTFTVRFISTIGLPPNIDDLMNAVEEIIPAHLIVQYAYRYLTIEEVENLTIGEINTHPLSDFAPFLD